MFKKKQSVLDDKEEVLDYLLSCERDSQNIISFGTNRYKAIEGISPERFVQILHTLKDEEFCTLQFTGHADPTSFCYVTLNNKALTYFEEIEKKQKEENGNFVLQHSKEIFYLVLGAVIVKAVESLFDLFF